MAEQAAKVKSATGKQTSAKTLKGYSSTRQRLQAFEQYCGASLQLEQMTLVDFYKPFRAYVIEHLGRELNTFGKYVAHLNTFLRWCEEDRELPVHRQYRKFTSPSRYVGVDALTDEELLRIAALEFRSEAARLASSKSAAPSTRKTSPASDFSSTPRRWSWPATSFWSVATWA